MTNLLPGPTNQTAKSGFKSDRASSVASTAVVTSLPTGAKDPTIIKVMDDDLKSDPYEGTVRGAGEGNGMRGEEGE